MSERILIVDDERDVNEYCARVLTQLGYQTSTATSGAEALEILGREPIALVVTDIMMPNMTGIELLEEAHRRQPNLAGLVMTGYSTTIDLAIKALRAGAQDFLPKPFSIVDLRDATEHALAQVRIKEQHARLKLLLPFLEINRQALSEVDEESLIAQFVDVASQESGADGAALFLNDDAQTLDLRLKRGTISAAIPGWELLAGRLSSHCEAQTLTAESDLPDEMREWMRATKLWQILCAPLCTSGHFLGMLLLTKRAESSSFSLSTPETITALASHVAALLENRHLLAELESWNHELELRVQRVTTDLRQVQEQLIAAERLAVIGRLGASIAHELRNPLGVINNSVYFLKTRLGNEDAKINKHLDIIEREVRTSNGIITDLMNFVRVKELQTSAADPGNLIAQSLERVIVPDGITVHTHIQEALPAIEADADKVQQIFLNLINNAAQAMPDGGELDISAIQKDGHVEFSFEDTGIGIPPENLERIFEPLFTTKAKGIGLGLAVVRLLTEAHHGSITVDSQVGQGSRFTVSLPCENEPKAEKGAA